ncbi:peptide ABC transporter substrate-binding protein [Paenisporosarcina sp. TG20]|uniref:peptide ABC transporter substrate-binding protein n=1 Tax=Paenisporosarcina sp. TG20 TaxID=1211706 RepID=UPI0002F7A09E|nr:peptide ABC transporter substrate-binding protein [Paenisporosarcina sp. TG20]
MKKNKLVWLLSLILILSVFLAACGDKEEVTETPATPTDKEETPVVEDVEEEQVLNLMMGAEIPTMDSSLVTDSVGFDLLNNVAEGLYRLDENNVPIPAMAEAEPTVSKDGLVYTFTIRDANWSNGTAVTAGDFEFAWKRAMNPETASEYGPYMMSGVIKNATEISAGEVDYTELGVKAIDEKTLEVTLEKPVPYFLSLMAFGTYLPLNEAFVTEQGADYATNSETLLSNGPFVLEAWDGTGLSWKLVKNDQYWDAETVQLTEINYDVVKETATGLNLYKTDKKDRAGLSGEFAAQYANDADLEKELESVLFYFKFNQERNGEATPLANVNIREAISKAYNKQDLVDVVLNNGSVPANYLVPKEFTFDANGVDFREINGDLGGFNVEEAQAAWTKGLAELGVEEVTLEILGGDSDVAKKMDEYFKAQLQGNLPGLTITLKQVPFSVRLDLDTNQDYDIQSAGWGPDYQDPNTFMNLFVTDGGNNMMSYSNPEYDKLIAAAAADLATDPEARWTALADAEKILLAEDFAIAPNYQRGTMLLVKPYVKGVVSHSFGGDFSYKWAYIEGKDAQ